MWDRKQYTKEITLQWWQTWSSPCWVEKGQEERLAQQLSQLSNRQRKQLWNPVKADRLIKCDRHPCTSTLIVESLQDCCFGDQDRHTTKISRSLQHHSNTRTESWKAGSASICRVLQANTSLRITNNWTRDSIMTMNDLLTFSFSHENLTAVSGFIDCVFVPVNLITLKLLRICIHYYEHTVIWHRFGLYTHNK